MNIGVLALQGAVSEHLQWLKKGGVNGTMVKSAEDLQHIDGLIIPGGESTAISRLILQNHLFEVIQHFASSHPVMGTCAGLILCATKIESDNQKVKPLGLIDMSVQRNGFGRQIDSFETPLKIKNIGDNVPSVFIRAPYISSVGNGVNILAEMDGKIVMAEQDEILVCAFHPELTDDLRIMKYFISKIQHE